MAMNSEKVKLLNECSLLVLDVNFASDQSLKVEIIRFVSYLVKCAVQ